MISIDTTNMCSHLQKKLFDEDGVYHHIWMAMQNNDELTAVVRSRQLHISDYTSSSSHCIFVNTCCSSVTCISIEAAFGR